MRSAALFAQKLSGELDRRVGIANDRGQWCDVSKDRNGYLAVSDIANNSYLSVARILEDRARHIDILDAYGVHHLHIAHYRLPPQRDYYDCTARVSSCGVRRIGQAHSRCASKFLAKQVVNKNLLSRKSAEAAA